MRGICLGLWLVPTAVAAQSVADSVAIGRAFAGAVVAEKRAPFKLGRLDTTVAWSRPVAAALREYEARTPHALQIDALEIKGDTATVRAGWSACHPEHSAFGSAYGTNYRYLIVKRGAEWRHVRTIAQSHWDGLCGPVAKLDTLEIRGVVAAHYKQRPDAVPARVMTIRSDTAWVSMSHGVSGTIVRVERRNRRWVFVREEVAIIR